MRVTVLVPTYRRPADLARCLAALQAQHRRADELLVLAREDDVETRALLAAERRTLGPLRVIGVRAPGLVAALNRGLDAATGDLVAICDDDAAPRRDWLARAEAHFAADARLGGLGGRDFNHPRARAAERRRVGRVQWFGRQIYHHDVGVGAAREVEFLKGCNMIFRRDAIAGLRFDARLRGAGAQTYNDTAFSMAARRAGWKLIYDPAVAVDHYPGPRFDADTRDRTFSARAIYDTAYNEMLIMLEYLPPVRRWVFVAYVFLVGMRKWPGLLHVPRLFARGERHVLARLGASLRGRAAGVRAFLQSREREEARACASIGR